MRNLVLLLLTCCIAFCSCQKELGPLSDYLGNTDSTGNADNNSTQLIKITQGVAQDTSYSIFYDTSEKPVKISLNQTDTLYIAYDTSGRVSEVIKKSGSATSFDMSYVYSNAGLLTNIQGLNSGKQEQYTFEYDASNRLAKKSFFTNNGLTLGLANYFTYAFDTNGDIIRINEYNASDTLTATSSITYSSIAVGALKTFALVNYANILGYDDILNIDYFFNQYMPSSINNQNGLTQFNYTKDASGNITQIISAGSLNTFTHNFFYQ